MIFNENMLLTLNGILLPLSAGPERAAY